MQVSALVLLDRMEQVERGRSQRDRMRRDVASFGWQRFAELFPEYVPTEAQVSSPEEIEAALAEDESTGETEAVSYDFSQADHLTQEEVEQELALLMAELSNGTASADDHRPEGWL